MINCGHDLTPPANRDAMLRALQPGVHLLSHRNVGMLDTLQHRGFLVQMRGQTTGSSRRWNCAARLLTGWNRIS